MKKLTIKKIGVLSAAKIAGILGCAMGLLLGLVYAVVFLVIGAAAMGQSTEEGAGLLAVGAGFVCIAPIAYGAFMFVCGALYAFIYNVAAGYIGGLEVEIEVGQSAESETF